jgi:SAM-dependent methyltransferase
MLDRNRTCPACASPYNALVQQVIGRRTKDLFDQFVCLDCRTFFHRSGYREDAEQKQIDLQFIINHIPRHTALFGELALEICTRAPHIKTVCEIGFGLGLLMQAFKNFGREPYGFEVNQYCVEYARNTLGLDCEEGLFTSATPGKWDAIVACMVFEHLEDPRGLFEVLRDHLNPDGVIYLSVPPVERESWPYLWTAGTKPGPAAPDVFYDNDVHINHFSVEGMRRLGESLGARSFEHWTSKDVYENSPGSYPSFLYRF